MLWPVVLPVQITCVVLLTAILLLTAFAKPKSTPRGLAFLGYSAFALVAFIPSCTGIMYAIDSIRFGDFQFATFEEVRDFRFQRCLPTSATDIRMRKFVNGYCACYKIPPDEFAIYLDSLWSTDGKFSSVKRGEIMGEGLIASREEFDLKFPGLGWDFPQNAIVHFGPTEPDGGGAQYYVDAPNGLVYQRTGFW